MSPADIKIADTVTKGIEQHWGKYNARPYALAAIASLNEAGYIIVPKTPNAEWITALDDRHILNDGKSPGGAALAKVIERVLATAPALK